MGKHTAPDPPGNPVGEPPGKLDGPPQKPGKHAAGNPGKKPTRG